MNKVIDWFARNGVAANLLMLLILLGGIGAATTTVQEVFPEFSLDAVQVRVTYPGGSPEEVEQSIVRRIEDRIEGVEGIDRILGTAGENVGLVTAELKRGTDLSRARTDIKSEVDRITAFPVQAEEPIVTEVTNRQQALQIALYGDASERVLKELAQRVKDDLTQDPQISFIQLSGVRDYEISVEMSREALRSYGLTLGRVAQLVREGSLDLPGGNIETAEEEITIRTEGQNYTKTDFEDLVLLSRPDGTTLRLGDVATVQDGFATNSDLITRFNGRPAAILNVFRTGDEQVLQVEETVKTYLDEDLASSLPAGIEAAIWQNQAENLRSRLNLLIENGILGLLLVIVALTLFLAPRLAFWTSVGIFLSFIGTFIVMQFLDVSINLLSLFGFILSIGIVVDDAIVVGENVFTEQENGGNPLDAAIRGTQRVGIPVIFAVLTTVAAFMPLLFIGGTIGKFLGDIPTIVIIVLLLSLVEVLFILPYHLSESPKRDDEASALLVRGLNRVRRRVAAGLWTFVRGPLTDALNFATRRYGVTICGGLALLLISFSFVANGYIGFSFFPSVQGKLVTAQLEMPAGTTPERTENITARLQETGYDAIEELETQAGQNLVQNVYVTVGQQPRATSGPDAAGFTPTQSNVAEVSFEMIDPEERAVTSVQFEERWREKTGQIPSARSLAFTASVVSVGEPVSVEISAPSEERLDRAVTAVRDSLERFGGVFDIQSDRDQGKREIELNLKPAARTLGLTLNDLAQQVRAGFFGVESYRLQRGQNEVRVYARLPDDERNAIADLDEYRIRTPSGADVPLEEVATAAVSYGPTQINRQDGRRVITVTADVNSAVTTGSAVTANLNSSVLPSIQRDIPGMTYQFGGQQRQQRKAQSSLVIGFLLALFAIYALLAIPFRSYLQPLVIMSTIPFAWIGALIGHLALDISLGLLSVFGIVGLSGVIVNDALVMLDFANEQRAKGRSWADALVRAGQMRFRPILLTSLTTFLGLFPIIIEQSVQAQFLIPMAVSLGAGILFGTAVLMLMVPSLAMLQRDATAWVQTTLLGYDEPSIHLGPYASQETE
ncbi:multidrug transporter AcrB [Salinibacter sp. 10B]|uniref:efflux RND transporter permease subunit n=1 Tax=Salinibacter sp. 10B TaxID=1923971 RepID=UPI000CF44A39|nr:efflux RND transporter permease subunit [Salinibacter sp. 10B]PQJ35041.1 multidrug transporter AcrB [Salinibacter sp. 10B]